MVRLHAAAVIAFLGLLIAASPLAQAQTADSGPGLIRAYCAGCHRETTPDHFERISTIRKTPEGWMMTLFRMSHVHGSRPPEEHYSVILRYLSDVQGLAPSEAAPARFALERRPNVPDLQLEDDLQPMCARCHTAARVVLQRRDAGEWLKLVHFHAGQFPTIEYHASARDRFWWQKATTELPVKLGSQYPFDTDAWRAWQTRPRSDLAGEWLVTGHTPGRGAYQGTARISQGDGSDYVARYSLVYADGKQVEGSSKAFLYTGYEWRGSGQLGDGEVREVYAVSEDGASIKGRWFLADHNEVGGDWLAVRAGSAARILAISPAALRVGTTQTVTIFGTGLDGRVGFGPGTRVKVQERGANTLIAQVSVDADAAPGYRTVTAGRASSADALAIYDRIDRVAVEPGYGIARVGGGKIAPVSAQFEVVGYLDMPATANRAAGTIRLGVLPASWSIEPFDAQAAAAQDVRFAGSIDQSGRFMPAEAGPNPQRKYSGNNVGNLSVVARVKDGEREVQGKSHLIVTVQRWNTPPIY
ncbi:MAG TPA: quinohemoprotein amine dehydrogenase subunit alpha [Steroidobacter sp.]|uniref:quinohemoprotein amine dehydrogenase subunit alpha n=1 Tax=Steroidobacter sp. TaxID=1978227 RepID=UPI002EDAF8D1